MKKIILVTLTFITLQSCAPHSDSQVNYTPPQGTKITATSNLKGIEFAHYIDSFEVTAGQYKIFAMLKNTGHKHYKYLQLNASYLDASGKEVAQSIGGPDRELMPGDSAVIETGWLFTRKEDLPAKVVLTTSN